MSVPEGAGKHLEVMFPDSGIILEVDARRREGDLSGETIVDVLGAEDPAEAELAIAAASGDEVDVRRVDR